MYKALKQLLVEWLNAICSGNLVCGDKFSGTYLLCLINMSICIKCPAILTFSSRGIPTFIFHCVRFYVRLEKIPGYCHYVPMAGTWNERNFKDLLEFSRKEMGKLCDYAFTRRLGITSRVFWLANKSPMWLANMVILMFLFSMWMV